MNKIKLKGWYEYKIIGVDGKVREEGRVDNAVVNAGFAQLALLGGDASAVPFTYLATGTSSTAVAVSQTALQGEITDSGLQRASATVSRVTTTVTNDTLQLFKSFAITGSKTVEEVGVFNDPTTGTMLSRALTTSKSFVSGEVYEVTYKLKFS